MNDIMIRPHRAQPRAFPPPRSQRSSATDEWDVSPSEPDRAHRAQSLCRRSPLWLLHAQIRPVRPPDPLIAQTSHSPRTHPQPVSVLLQRRPPRVRARPQHPLRRIRRHARRRTQGRARAPAVRRPLRPRVQGHPLRGGHRAPPPPRARHRRRLRVRSQGGEGPRRGRRARRRARQGQARRDPR